MKYCSKCGKEIFSEAVICPHCGCSVADTVHDIPSTGLNVLSFLLPIVGLILYIVDHNKCPNKANAAGKWALIGFVVGIALQVFCVFLI